MARHTVFLLLAAALLALIAGISCDPLTPGNLIVQRFGDGTPNPNLYTCPIFLLEVDSETGEIVQNFTVPTVAEGANHGSVGSFMNVKSGRLSLTPCGELVVFGGMEIPPYVAPTFGNRVFGSIDPSGTVDTATWLPPSTNNNHNEHGYSRGVTANGTEHFWASLSATTAYAYYGGTPNAEEIVDPAIAAGMQVAGWELYSLGQWARLLQWGNGMPTSGFVATTVVEFGFGGAFGLRIVDANPNEPGADLFYVGTNEIKLCKWAKINGTWTGLGCSQSQPTWDDALNTFITDIEVQVDPEENTVTVWYSMFTGIYTFVDQGGIAGPIEGNSSLLVPVTPAANAHFAGVALVPSPVPCCPICTPTPTPAPCETPTPVPCDTPTPVPPPTCTVDQNGRRRRSRRH